MLSRTYKAMTIRAALIRNGMRHPHCMNAGLFSPMVWFTPRKVRLVSKTATPPPTRVNMPYRPRWRAGADSALSNADPAHSPPTPSPCSNRRATRISGAAAPMAAVLGTRPTATVDTAMISSVATRVFFRPSRSPKCPNTAAPTGRDRKAVANVPIEAIVATAGPRCGKNTVGKTSAAAVP
ncbi:hypothetical protein MSHI_04080 [Mycobacterium shinjukuense]|uniref:Uncharacterized protein n=1 Tax=Mycobacterium shinjukuense TaxID=398694 RepID=A0A7I7MKW9_9MYCO|nr:hypothetical protein MSHI_04080 [Mycobacterium shinjukuense]